ncbi:MAG: diguanylate cyclase [Steroidobacteraceae bacterium]|nr:diguanylate cyclase [Steroidobacteraceae bacterium]
MHKADSQRATDESVITQILPALALMPRVLLVDDDEIVIERMRDLITAAGYEVSTATSGDAALAELEREFAPIVILDRSMPGMDGLELCRTIRLGRNYPGYVYLMLCTMHDSEEEILSGLDAGADDYLSKRTSGTQLIARLATARRILSLEHSLKAVIEERRRMAMTDALTGAHNRRYFMSHLRRELKRMRRFGGELSLLVFDIDHFKHINDRYGHGAGDVVLVEFVRRVQAALPREFDWCARLGGEEFAVVLPQTEVAGGAVVAEKVRLAIAATPVATPAGAVEMTVSVGVSGISAFSDRGAVTVEQILRRADDCLYSSKHNGRNRVTLDEPDAGAPAKPLKTLLYVDDDADIREIVEMSLGLDGDLRVLSSDGGERALLKMGVEKPDLVVLDVMMPSIDGPTMVKRMRADPELRHIPVIFLTAKSDPEEIARLRQASIGVIAKPFDPMALGGQVKALWNGRIAGAQNEG